MNHDELRHDLWFDTDLWVVNDPRSMSLRFKVIDILWTETPTRCHWMMVEKVMNCVFVPTRNCLQLRVK